MPFKKLISLRRSRAWKTEKEVMSEIRERWLSMGRLLVKNNKKRAEHLTAGPQNKDWLCMAQVSTSTLKVKSKPSQPAMESNGFVCTLCNAQHFTVRLGYRICGWHVFVKKMIFFFV
jgi:hypothetical protein